MTFGQWANCVRLAKRMTLDEVAAKSGKVKSCVWDIEQDRHNPGLETASAIAGALGFKLSEAMRECERYEDHNEYFVNLSELFE